MVLVGADVSRRVVRSATLNSPPMASHEPPERRRSVASLTQRRLHFQGNFRPRFAGPSCSASALKRSSISSIDLPPFEACTMVQLWADVTTGLSEDVQIRQGHERPRWSLPHCFEVRVRRLQRANPVAGAKGLRASLEELCIKALDARRRTKVHAASLREGSAAR